MTPSPNSPPRWHRPARPTPRPSRAVGAVVVLAALLVLVLTACRSSPASSSSAVPGGDPSAGRDAIAALGCGSCHTVPGVRGADGLVAPSLAHFSRRAVVAGVLANEPQNLERWIRDPQGVVPGNAMPDLGVGEQQARDIAAYLMDLE